MSVHTERRERRIETNAVVSVLCDRCGAETFEPFNASFTSEDGFVRGGYVEVRLHFGSLADDSLNNKRRDLCDKCIGEFVTWIGS
jgi:hypothetical protein